MLSLEDAALRGAAHDPLVAPAALPHAAEFDRILAMADAIADDPFAISDFVTALETFYENQEASGGYELPLPLVDFLIAVATRDRTDLAVASSIFTIFTHISVTKERTPAINRLLGLTWDRHLFEDSGFLWLSGNLFQWLNSEIQASIVATLIPQLPVLLRVPDLSRSAVHLLHNVCIHCHLSYDAMMSIADTIVTIECTDEEIVSGLIHILQKIILDPKYGKRLSDDPRILALCHDLLSSDSDDILCAAVSIFGAFAFLHKVELSCLDFARIVAVAERSSSELLLQCVFECLLNAFCDDAVPDSVTERVIALLWRAVESGQYRTQSFALLLYSNIVPRRDLHARVRMLTSPLFAALLPVVEFGRLEKQATVLKNIWWAVKKTEAEGIGRELCEFLAEAREMFERILAQAEQAAAERIAAYCRDLLGSIDGYSGF
jgi:hypothetical protein